MANDVDTDRRFLDEAVARGVMTGEQAEDCRRILATLAEVDVSLTAADVAIRKAHLSTVEGTVPGLRSLPSGCRFHPRCAHAAALCRERVPALHDVAPGHDTACHWVAGELDS